MKIINQYKNMSVQVKAALWYTICNFLQKGISFLIIPIYIRLLTTGEYGEWMVFQSWSEILIIFASLNLYCGVYTKTIVDIQDDRDRYTSSMQGLGTVITVVMFIVYLGVRGFVEKWSGLNTTTMCFLFVYFLVYPAFQFWAARQRVEYKYKKMVAVTISIAVLTPALSILILTHTDLRAKAIIYGYLIVQCVFGAFFYIFQFIKGKIFCDKKYWKYALKFNVPLIPHYLSLIVLGQSDRIMIKNICGDSDAGVYSFAYQIASAMNVLIAAINGSRVPWTYEQLRDRVYTQLRRISTLLCVLMGAIALIVSLLAPEVVRIIGTSDYAAAVYVIPVVALGVFFTFIYDLFCSVEFYYSATKYVMVASCVGAILNIVLNAVFIPIFGFIAAAYTTLVCYFVFMLMHFVFMRKVCVDQKIKESVYDLKSIFGLAGATVAISFLSMLTYGSDLVRYICLLVVAALIVLKRNTILDAYKGMRK